MLIIYENNMFNVTVGHGSHLPVLMKTMEVSNSGPVLEIGMGFYSTSYLHWKCYMQGRELDSYEDNGPFIDKFKRLKTDSHRIHLINSYDELSTDGHWSVVFIDHGPNTRRITEIERFADKADYMIIHDTEARRKDVYSYHKVLPLFKYRYDFKGTYPETSVVSNFKNLEEFKNL